ncbi:MAG: hypothetical protein WBN56_00310 [Robiginitalea sp.]|uniref:hypothetical protein n=1 Tax=Robiginitalea sp. TaxID=1902411 RepID=UPI003C73D68F
MKDDSKNPKGINRRKFLPILGSGLLLPLLPATASTPNVSASEEQEYQTLLKPDGTAVRVKVSSLKKSNVVKKNISNAELRNWLDKDKKD